MSSRQFPNIRRVCATLEASPREHATILRELEPALVDLVQNAPMFLKALRADPAEGLQLTVDEADKLMGVFEHLNEHLSPELFGEVPGSEARLHTPNPSDSE